MRLVLQCAMCGTLHEVGTGLCSACRATGLTQLRLVFECPACGRLDLVPTCGTCHPFPPYEVVDPFALDDLIECEVVPDEPFLLDGCAEEFDIEPTEEPEDERTGTGA